MTEEVKEFLPQLIETLKSLNESDEFSNFHRFNSDLYINEEDGIVMENLSEKKDKCDKHIVSAIHHFEDCLYKLGYDLSDITPSPFEEGN